ncbi:MAG: hypothetical protein U1F66_01550 [bacterium]
MKFAPIVVLLALFAFLPAGLRAQDATPPEEPDYAFVTGSPYTEGKRFLQVISTEFFSQDDSPGLRERQLSHTLRFEYGFTDRLEADLVLNYNQLWSSGPASAGNAHGFGETVLGLRYRILDEEHTPITLTFGPQILPPTGSFSDGFGTGGFGLAWDLTLAKEWNSWFFHYVSVNYATTFGARDPTAGSQALFTLHNLNWGLALGFRPVEKKTSSGGKHDLHLTLETSGTLEQEVQAGPSHGSRSTSTSVLLVPGLRYGYITARKRLFEIGLAGVLGLTEASPDWGLILQTQWEFGF